jgi:hypothetical protein
VIPLALVATFDLLRPVTQAATRTVCDVADDVGLTDTIPPTEP